MPLKLELGCWTKGAFEVCRKALRVYQSLPVSMKHLLGKWLPDLHL